MSDTAALLPSGADTDVEAKGGDVDAAAPKGAACCRPPTWTWSLAVVVGLAALLLLALVLLPLKAADGKEQGPSDEDEFRKCGVRGAAEVGTRVVNGVDSEECRWRWQAYIATPAPWDPTLHARCSAVILNDQWVITAGSCLIPEALPANISVWVGVNRRSNMSFFDGNVQPLRVSETHLHPNRTLRDGLYQYNVALLRLAQPLNMSQCVGSVCLPKSDSPAADPAGATKGWITGFGRAFTGPPWVKDTLQEAISWVQSRPVCAGVLESFNMTLGEETFCAIGNGTTGVGIENHCLGDGGAPMVWQDPENGQFVLIGVYVAGDDDCGIGFPNSNGTLENATGTPGLYLRVGAVVPWILDVIGGNSQQYYAGEP